MQETVDTYRLPVTRIFFEALQLPRRHAVALLRIGFPFLTVLLALAVVGSCLQDESSSPLSSWGAFTIIAIVFAATLVMAVVGCHRTFLLEAEDVEETKTVRWGGRETRFVGWWIVIGLCAGLIAIPTHHGIHAIPPPFSYGL